MQTEVSEMCFKKKNDHEEREKNRIYSIPVFYGLRGRRAIDEIRNTPPSDRTILDRNDAECMEQLSKIDELCGKE